jgi:hypothetical protein
MRRAMLMRLSLLAVLLAIAMTGACGSTSTTRTGISGSVRNWSAFGGTVPVAGNQVVCYDAATQRQVQAVHTDHLGRFFFSVPAGRYEVNYTSGSKQGPPVEVTVTTGHVTTLEPFIGVQGGPGSQEASPDQRLKKLLQPYALALGVKKKTAQLAVSGATVGAAAKLFGSTFALPADTDVWVCVLTGKVEGPAGSAASRDLARGGFVAYELRASTLELLATRSVPRRWRLLDWAAADDWGGSDIFPLF